MEIFVLIGIGLIILQILFALVVFGKRKRSDAPRVVIPEESTPTQTHSLKYLKERCALLEQREIQRQLYLELNRVFSTAKTFKELMEGAVESICRKLDVQRGAFLWKNAKTGTLEFRYEKGYGVSPGFSIPLYSSLAGLCVKNAEPHIWENPENESYYTHIGQITESNLLCSPIRLFGDVRGVLRFANINLKLINSYELIKTFQLLMPLVSSALEKVLVLQENSKRNSVLGAINGITKTLHKTLDVTNICAACSREIKTVFHFSYFTMVRIYPDDTTRILYSTPREMSFTSSQARSRIILRNICIRKEPLCIEDMKNSESFKSVNRDIASLLVVPLFIRKTIFGAVLVAADKAGQYNGDDLTLLTILGEHIAATLERALYFKSQEDRAARDGLTGLFNHRIFHERLAYEVDRSRRYRRPLSIIMLDIDFFKKFNDTYGHQTGDTILKAVGECLQESVRRSDIPCRYGGEEFMIILPETAFESALIMAKRINETVGTRSVSSSYGDLSVTVSVGVAALGMNGCESGSELIKNADTALYEAKKTGRNRVCPNR
jgi:diguanylate cyclase (GGDEF)-like protein